MNKVLIIITIVVSFIVGITVTGYIIVRRITSDETIKSRLLSTFKDFGEVKIDHAHMDFLEGVTIDNLSLVCTSGDLQGKSFKIPKIVLKINPRSLIKGQFNVSNDIVIDSELTVEKTTDIW